MPRKPRIHYTETDKALMWDRWRKGDSLETANSRPNFYSDPKSFFATSRAARIPDQ